jgi:hypothetical protein
MEANDINRYPPGCIFPHIPLFPAIKHKCSCMLINYAIILINTTSIVNMKNVFETL